MTGAENMALDGIILEEINDGYSPPTFRFLRFDPPVALISYNQDVAQEVREDYCRENGIAVNRRQTGGGAILFEKSMLGFELFWPLSKPGLPSSFAEVTAMMAGLGAEALTMMGAPAAFRPRNDIEINGKKVSGTGMAFLSRAFMFQGTVLVDNCLDSMLRALRIPVEKLKRREIQSLLQRLTFLSDELGYHPDMTDLKAAFVEVFSQGLGLELVPQGLTDREQDRLAAEAPFYESDDWIYRRQVKGKADELLRAQSGRLNVALWADMKRKTIKQALITGDFFTNPTRLIYDLEGFLRGGSIKPDRLARTVDEFFETNPGELIDVSREELTNTLLTAAQKGAAPWPDFNVVELNRIHPLCLELNLEGWRRPNWLLLPYCAKEMDCALRHRDGCDVCGLCDIGDMYNLADRRRLIPITITSFEHLMAVLEDLARNHPGETYIASCCTAFLAKHQHEMEATGVKGIIVDLNSLTCYDLGKETKAYAGTFEKQSQLETGLMTKVIDFLSQADRETGESA